MTWLWSHACLLALFCPLALWLVRLSPPERIKP